MAAVPIFLHAAMPSCHARDKTNGSSSYLFNSSPYGSNDAAKVIVPPHVFTFQACPLATGKDQKQQQSIDAHSDEILISIGSTRRIGKKGALDVAWGIHVHDDNHALNHAGYIPTTTTMDPVEADLTAAFRAMLVVDSIRKKACKDLRLPHGLSRVVVRTRNASFTEVIGKYFEPWRQKVERAEPISSKGISKGKLFEKLFRKVRELEVGGIEVKFWYQSKMKNPGLQDLINQVLAMIDHNKKAGIINGVAPWGQQHHFENFREPISEPSIIFQDPKLKQEPKKEDAKPQQKAATKTIRSPQAALANPEAPRSKPAQAKPASKKEQNRRLVRDGGLSIDVSNSATSNAPPAAFQEALQQGANSSDSKKAAARSNIADFIAEMVNQGLTPGEAQAKLDVPVRVSWRTLLNLHALNGGGELPKDFKIEMDVQNNALAAYYESESEPELGEKEQADLEGEELSDDGVRVE